jgi:hypothetical protein
MTRLIHELVLAVALCLANILFAIFGRFLTTKQLIAIHRWASRHSR